LLTLLDHLPDGFLEASSAGLHEVLPGPTLIELPGQREDWLFVSVLLHGNEDTGLKAVQDVLRAWNGRPLPRGLAVFVGNPAAARANVRHLADQRDFNRVWPGAPESGTPEQAMARAVFERMQGRRLFASMDIHNSTGLNPHYACVTRLGHDFLHLAALFSRTVVYFTRPVGVQTAAFSALCPAVTLECGKAGKTGSEEHASSFLEACLRLQQFPGRALEARELDLYHTVATVTVPPEVRFSFDGNEADLMFVPDLDHMNFRELPPGTPWADVGGPGLSCLRVTDEAGREVREEFFELRGGRLLTRRAAIPALLTRDVQVIRQDCLCYLMERLALPSPRAA
jgi:succinylglutamate desuccinylase